MREPKLGDVIHYAGMNLTVMSEPILCSGMVDMGQVMPDFWSLDVRDESGNTSNFCPDVSEVLAYQN